MKAVILAGGKGRRMCAESTNLPKPLVAIGGIPIIFHIINYFQFYGVGEVVIGLGYQSRQVVTTLQEYLRSVSRHVELVESLHCVTLYSPELSLHIELVDTGLDTCTGGRLRQIRPFLNKEPFFLAWCDGLADLKLDSMLNFHKNHGRLATVAAVHPRSRFGIMELTGGEVSGFQEKPRMTDRWVNSGYAILEPEVISYIHSDEEQWEAEPISRLIKDHQLMAWQHEGQWQCMDTVSDWEYLKDLWDSGSAFWRPEMHS